jgi:hypothetical protein
MDNRLPITDDDIQRIVDTKTMAEFRAAIAPWQDDGGARKKMVQKLHGGIDDYFTWQKHEALRLWRELEGAEPTVATVLAAEVRRFSNRLAGKDYAAVNGLVLEFAPGFLGAIEKRFAAHGNHGPDVHRAVMEEIADPVSRYISRKAKNIPQRLKKYPNTRMMLDRGANGAPVFTMTSPEEQADEAEKKRKRDAHALNIAQIPDIGKFIGVLTAQDPQSRKTVKEQLGSVTEDPLLSWQKREVFDMLSRKETPDAAQLQMDARLDAALEQAKTQFSQQFRKAIKHLPVILADDARRSLSRAALDANDPQGGTVRHAVKESFVAPVLHWVRQHFDAVAAQAEKFPDSTLVVDDVVRGGAPRAHLYSARDAMNQWVRTGAKTTAAITAPRTASFRRAPKPVT